MHPVAIVFIAVGVLASAVTLAHDLKRLRISREIPQGAPKRVAPEVHVLGAILTGIGVSLVWDRWVGVAIAAAQVFLAFVVIRLLIQRLLRG